MNVTHIKPVVAIVPFYTILEYLQHQFTTMNTIFTTSGIPQTHIGIHKVHNCLGVHSLSLLDLRGHSSVSA